MAFVDSLDKLIGREEVDKNIWREFFHALYIVFLSKVLYGAPNRTQKEPPMKIVAINGSPTGIEGTTGKILAALLEGAKKEGAEVQLFELGAGTVKPCISCHTCQTEGQIGRAHV